MLLWISAWVTVLVLVALPAAGAEQPACAAGRCDHDVRTALAGNVVSGEIAERSREASPPAPEVSTRRPPPQAAVTPRARPPSAGRRGSALLRLPDPEIATTPPGESVTQFPTEVTVVGPASRVLHDEAAVPSARLLIRAVPERQRFTFGDGRRPLHTTTGRASHTYRTWGCYEVRVEVVWRAEYSVDGGPFQVIGRTVTRKGFARPVIQVVGVLVDGGNPPPDTRRPGEMCAHRERFPVRADPWALSP